MPELHPNKIDLDMPFQRLIVKHSNDLAVQVMLIQQSARKEKLPAYFQAQLSDLDFSVQTLLKITQHKFQSQENSQMANYDNKISNLKKALDQVKNQVQVLEKTHQEELEKLEKKRVNQYNYFTTTLQTHCIKLQKAKNLLAETMKELSSITVK